MTKLNPASLSFIVCEILNIKFDSVEFKDVMYATMKYVICHTNIKEYHKSLTDVVDFKKLEITPAQFRLSLNENAYVIKNLKYYCAYLTLSKDTSKFKAEELACIYDVIGCDAYWLYKNIIVSLNFSRDLRKYCRDKKLSKNHYSPVEYSGLSMEFSSMLEPVMMHAKRGVFKKLRFITRYHNIAPSDFTSEIMCHVIKAFYQSKPNNFEPAHQINYLKSTTTSRILNMIDCYTSLKRQRLVNMGTDNKEGAKFVLLTTAESQLPIGAEGEMQSLESLGEGEHWLNVSDKQDFNLSLERLLQTYGNKKRGDIIRIFTGQEVPKFTLFLKKKRIIRTENKTSQDVVQAKTFEEIKELVAEYLNIKNSSVTRALKECSHDLGL